MCINVTLIYQNVNFIRWNRIPLHEALISELNEDGYISSAHFISQLITYQKQQVEIHGEDSKIGLRPKLINFPEYLQKLYDTFKEAEIAHYEGDTTREYDIVLETAIFFAYGPEDWWWLGEQLLLQCINIIYRNTEDGGRRDATCQYLVGRFLLLHNEEVEQSMPYLDAARVQSKNTFWSAKKVLQNTTVDCSNEETIFFESCKLLYKALMITAESTRKTDPEYSAQLCSIARKRANEACFYAGEAEAYMLQGHCEFECMKYEAAILSFNNSLRKQIKAESPEGICKVRILIQKAYTKIGKYENAFECLRILLEYAKANKLAYYIGLAYRYIGEYYLHQGRACVATPNLLKSLNILHNIDALTDVEQVRNFAAISAGQELMTNYVRLIINVGQETRCKGKYIYKALGWKDTREQFWSDDELSVCSSYLFGSITPSSELEDEMDYSNLEYDMPEEETAEIDYYLDV
ncbi:uncharacterized protein LOC108741507 isoform X2 [Agrilus planipennis]|uniref:Tetratricopeptide repeat protein 29 n=1 Tax=Agrilus planipennis TaxID=224129 RepID=A0A1W4XHA5_AGRPL|nr:uncharacterized protein LOC108741507 isoform X2 [Agrilus planipennis]